MNKRFLILMASFLIFIGGMTYALADTLALTDNTAVTDSNMRRCMQKSVKKNLILTGAATDTFLIVEDGVDIVTVTIASSSEKWETDSSMNDLKVNWTAVAGSPAATLECFD